MSLKSLKDAAKNVFFEEDPAAQPPNPASTASPQAVPASTPVSSPSVQLAVDPGIKDKLDEVIAGANQASYTEFSAFLEAMSAIGDERTRYTAALSATRAKKFTLADVMRGIDVIIQTLGQEERSFTDTLPEQLQEKVGAREDEIKDIERQVTQKTTQLETLRSDINQLGSRKAAAARTIESERKRIDDLAKRFAATVAALRGHYENEKQRIAQYGGEK